MKMLTVLTALTLISSSVAVAEIYKYRAQDGSVVFSDQKNPDGEQEVIEMSPPNVVPLSTPSVAASQAGRTPAKKPSQPEDLYSSLSIEAPANGEAIRANDGVVSVSVNSIPMLDIGAGDLVRLVVDGTPAAQGVSTDIRLDGLERGQHQVVAEIIDIDGQILKRSAAVTFQVLKYSALFNKK